MNDKYARVGTAVISRVKVGDAPTPGCAASPGAVPTYRGVASCLLPLVPLLPGGVPLPLPQPGVVTDNERLTTYVPLEKPGGLTWLGMGTTGCSLPNHGSLGGLVGSASETWESEPESSVGPGSKSRSESPCSGLCSSTGINDLIALLLVGGSDSGDVDGRGYGHPHLPPSPLACF